MDLTLISLKEWECILSLFFYKKLIMYDHPKEWTLQSFHRFRFATITKELQLEGLYQDCENSTGKEQWVGR